MITLILMELFQDIMHLYFKNLYRNYLIIIYFFLNFIFAFYFMQVF